MEPGRGTAYWWPLVCEVLRDHDFRFEDPELSEKMSSFYYSRYLPPYEGEKRGIEEMTGSFRDLWDEVYQQVGSVVVPFLWKDNDFSMEVAFGEYPDSEQGPMQVHVDFQLAGGQIYNSTLEEARAMMKRVLLCFKDLYELCRPVSAQVYWEDSVQPYAPWVLFGETPPNSDAERGPDRLAVNVYAPSEYQLLKEPLSDGKFLFLFDPIPIPSARVWAEGIRWAFLSLDWP